MRKIRKFKNKKLNSGKILGLASLILVGGLITSCNNVGLRKQHQYTRTEFNSSGEYKETRQFKPFDSNNNRDLSNSYIYYGEWEQTEDSRYQREVKEYDIRGRSYDELKDVICSNEKTEELLGKPRDTYVQISDSITEEEKNKGSYCEATIYTEDNNKVVYVKDSEKNIWILIGSGIILPFAVGAAIAWNKINEKQEKKEEAKKLTLKQEN